MRGVQLLFRSYIIVPFLVLLYLFIHFFFVYAPSSLHLNMDMCFLPLFFFSGCGCSTSGLFSLEFLIACALFCILMIKVHRRRWGRASLVFKHFGNHAWVFLPCLFVFPSYLCVTRFIFLWEIKDLHWNFHSFLEGTI